MDLNLILRISQEFYDENPMMITTLVIFVLVYAYYRARVVQLPLIHCIVAADGTVLATSYLMVPHLAVAPSPE